MKNQNQYDQAGSHLVFQVDKNIRVTPYTIQIAFDKAKQNNNLKGGLSNIFSLLQNLHRYRTNPQDETLKKFILNQLETLNDSEYSQPESMRLKLTKYDGSKMLPMNKGGAIGTIERKCRFVQKGVQQFEQGKKQPKFKQIKGFNNRIQKLNDKTNTTKLPWIKQEKKYPYRIVLIDKNNAEKGIYFISPQEARSVQVFLISKYNLKLSTAKLTNTFDKLSKIRENSFVDEISNKLIQKLKINKLNRRSQTSKGKTNNEQRGNMNFRTQNQFNRSQVHNQSIFQQEKRNSNTLSHQFNEGKFSPIHDETRTEFNFKKNSPKKQLSVNNKILNEFQIRTMQQYQRKNIEQFFRLWRDKTRQQKSPQLKNIKTKEQKVGQNNQAPVKSLEIDSWLVNLINKNILDDDNISQKPQSYQKQSNQSIKLQRLSLYTNSKDCFKPMLDVELYHESQQMPIILGFNTICSSNQKNEENHIEYELLLDEDNGKYTENAQEQGKIKIKYPLQQYQIIIKLSDQLSEDILIQKEVDQKNINLIGQNLQIYLQAQSIPNEVSEQRLMSIKGKYIIKKQLQNNKQVFNYLTANFLYTDFQSNKIPKNQQNNLDSIKNPAQITIQPLDQLIISRIEQINSAHNNQLVLSNILTYVPSNRHAIKPSQHELQILSKVNELLKTMNIPFQLNSYLRFLKTLQLSQICKNQSDLIENLISMIVNWSTKLTQCSNQETNLAKVLGFENNEIDKVSEKMCISFMLLEFLLNQECPHLLDKLNRKNIPIVYLLFENCHYLLTKNLQPSICLQLLSNIFNRNDACPEIMLFLVQIYLCKNWEDQLKNCYKLEEVKFLLENTSTLQNIGLSSSQSIWSYVERTHAKYFSHESMKTYHEAFQKMKNFFYQIESQYLAEKKNIRFAQKCGLAKKLLQISPFNVIDVPYYKPKSYCLHIIFTTLPQISGSLYLKTNFTQFECTCYESNPYFIIPNLNSSVKLQFIDSKSNEYSVDLIFDQRFSRFKISTHSQRNGVTLQFEYWAGLIENEQIQQNYQYTKKIHQCLSSFTTIEDIKYHLNKQFTQSNLLKHFEKISQRASKSDTLFQELNRKIKTSFSDFQNKINQYDLFLYLIANSKISLKQKIFSIQEFSSAISTQIFLSENTTLERIMIYDLFKIMEIPIKKRQFEPFYQIFLSNFTQIQLPKIFKARFSFIHERNQQIKLENQVYEYIQEKRKNYLYPDIQINELLVYLRPVIVKNINDLEKQFKKKIAISMAELKLVVSSEGELTHYKFRINIRNNNRQFSVDDTQFSLSEKQKEIIKAEPKILAVKVQNNYPKTPSSQKYVQNFNENLNNSSSLKFTVKNFQSQFKQKSIDSPTKYPSSEIKIGSKSNVFLPRIEDENNSGAINVNLCKFVIPKSKHFIPFRYKKTKKSSKDFDSFDLFEDLNNILLEINANRQLKSIKDFYVNGAKTISLDFLQNNSLTFRQDENSQLIKYQNELGIQNNLRLIAERKQKIQKVYFYTTSQPLRLEIYAKILINYGNGVIRWQNSMIKGYFILQSFKKNHKQKKVYLTETGGNESVVDEKYVQSSGLSLVPYLGKIDQNTLMKLNQFRS